MRRRSFLAGFAGMAWLVHAPAQQSGRTPRVGLMIAQAPDHAFPRAFRDGLRQLGYVEGKNIQLEVRSVKGAVDRFVAVADELAKKGVDVIVAGGGTVGVKAALKASNSIPIVFPIAGDPVQAGLVQSLARPGGNVTGLAMLDDEMSAKRVQLVKDVLPRVERIGVLADPNMGRAQQNADATRTAGEAMGAKVVILRARTLDELPAAFSAARDAKVQALLVLASSFFSANYRDLLRLAVQQPQILAVWEHRLYTDAGGLMSYGPDIAHMYRTAARYVDKILKGARPGELPVEQATKFDLVINLKTAKAQGIKIPHLLLARADQLIE
jgi:putative ABC transport system substrate-binding protein